LQKSKACSIATLHCKTIICAKKTKSYAASWVNACP
jgi:hypothetical protein